MSRFGDPFRLSEHGRFPAGHGARRALRLIDLEDSMTRSIALLPVVGALFALGGTHAHASAMAESHPIAARVPNTAAAAKWADLIARTEQALGNYAAACASGEEQAL